MVPFAQARLFEGSPRFVAASWAKLWQWGGVLRPGVRRDLFSISLRFLSTGLCCSRGTEEDRHAADETQQGRIRTSLPTREGESGNGWQSKLAPTMPLPCAVLGEILLGESSGQKQIEK